MKSGIIAFYTFKEILKSKVLISVFFAGIGLMIVTYIATEFTYGVPERIALDFGLGVLSLSSLAISIFLGVTLISKEIDSRTIYMIISRPVSRLEFIIGKILGLLGIQALNVFLLSLMTFLCLMMLDAKVSDLFLWAIMFTFVESILLLLVVLLISLVVNNTLATIWGVVLLVIGHSVKDAHSLSFVENRPFLKMILDFYHFILPGFYKLNLKDYLIYKHSLPFSYLASCLLYAFCYSLFLILLMIFVFNRKNLD